MGVLNVTPDSFYDGGRFFQKETAVARAFELAVQGADLIDLGGESTRPGAFPVSADDEWRRIGPVLETLLREGFSLPISVDTYKARVAQRALDAGAAIINDVTALRDPQMAEIVAGHGAGLVLMHMQGTPPTMQANPRYRDVVTDVVAFLRERMEQAGAAGIAPEGIAIDPGLGFGKTVQHNIALLQRLREFSVLERPLLIGPSRKSFIAKTLAVDPTERRRADTAMLAGTAAAVALAVLNGARIVRVHDVEWIAPMTRMLAALTGVEK